MSEWLEFVIQSSNEALAAIIVIVSASILLYNLSRNLHARVARTSSALLACVTIVYMVDVLTSLNPTRQSLEIWLRFQWIGIAFAPAAMFHLSDALLATTGMVSRGRRRRVSRLLYVLSFIFLLIALLTDVLVHGLSGDPAPHLLPGPLFVLYVAYFITAVIVSVYNVWRARDRCLTTYTNRRMGYLLYSFTLPAFGIFPYSMLFAEPGEGAWLFWALVILSNVGIATMLLLMAYPLSFFGSNIPDRVVKAELLRFFLRGPFAGIIVLMVILFMPQAGRILGLPGEEFMPFAAVALLMFWQWMVSLTLPFLERYIVYPDDQDEIQMVQSVGQRLVTESDAHQLFEAILAAVCDLLQVRVAFVATFSGEALKVEQVVGEWQPGDDWNGGVKLSSQVHEAVKDSGTAIGLWDSFWVVPLHSNRVMEGPVPAEAVPRMPLGVLAVQARNAVPDLTSDEQLVFDALMERAAQALDDRVLQMEVFAALEGLLPEMDAVQRLRDAARYGDFPTVALSRDDESETGIPAEFVDAVRDALRDYWGGPRLTKSSLLNLGVVKRSLGENENNATRALRSILHESINRLRPEGERSMTRAEWTLYNIIELRFVQGLKVRDVAKRLVMSEADLYRKQRAAIEEVARVLTELELSEEQAFAEEPLDRV